MYARKCRSWIFASPKAPDIINGWCAGKTNNCIPKVLNEIPETARLYLLNALYFKGIWKNQFKKIGYGRRGFLRMLTEANRLYT